MLRELTPELAEIAKNELNEDPKSVRNDLQHLKDWLSKQPHLISRTDDQWLIALLRGCKFSLEKVKIKLDLYYTLKTTAPDITLRLNPTEPKFLEFLKLGVCMILPTKKSEKLSPRVILIRVGKYNPDKNHIADIFCTLYYLVQILAIEDDVATVVGTKVVVDYDGVTMNHVAQGSPGLLKNLVAVSQDSLPLRLKGSHHINVPSGIDMIFKIVKSFLNEKAKQRLIIHESPSELLEVLPNEMIPNEYGGNGGTIDDITDYWCKKIVEYKTWMETEIKLGTDESKRLGQLKSSAIDTGLEGSFRKLEID